jgi:hypothetical protein
MNTTITFRKTPHAVKTDLWGDKFIMTVEAWCFENGNVDDKLVMRQIPICQCFVKPGRQDIPDYELTLNDVRPYHVDVWSAKAKNQKKTGFFMTDYELNNFVFSLIEQKQKEKEYSKIFWGE